MRILDVGGRVRKQQRFHVGKLSRIVSVMPFIEYQHDGLMKRKRESVTRTYYLLYHQVFV